MNSQDKTMLALAALTYRGFGLHSEADIEAALTPWLPKLEREGLGVWEPVWGPATFRVPTSLVDDAMIFVARERQLAPGASPHYAIAIRGTNPVSAFDWVFGDFWVGLQVDWTPPGTPPAKLSASTALGLAIAQGLAAAQPASRTNAFAALGAELAGALQGLATKLPEIDPRQLLTDTEALKNFNPQARIAALTNAAGDALRQRGFAQLWALLEGTSTPLQLANQHVYDRLLKRIQETKRSGERKTLLEFLAGGAVARGARVDVTGHSKGGALAIATALWLEEHWAAAHAAEIHCYSFAGPTPGNEAFARRYNTALSQRTRRIVNHRDIVPQAWVPDAIAALEKHYPMLALALRALAKSMRKLDYVHVDGAVVEIAAAAKHSNPVREIIHQHLDAYLAAAQFQDPTWNAASLFLQD